MRTAVLSGLAISTAHLYAELLLLLRLRSKAEYLAHRLSDDETAARPQALSLAASIFERTGKLELALQCYTKASDSCPDEAFYHVEMASIYEKQGDVQNAVNNYQKALSKGDGFAAQFREKIATKVRDLQDLK